MPNSTSSVHQLRDDIAVVGWACRLPGANSIPELWSLLLERRCAISRVPDDRFSLGRFGHPRKQERGKSYTWAAGILDDVWGFDPGVFGISPREAVQIDPQQRIILQLTWEALEDAGITPSSIANSEVGVYVGASQTDYAHAFFGDPAIADAHFGPGTSLAIISNRISYVYGLHGPSLTIDTACSSSLVALHQAVEALRGGRIETAIVGGTNLIASPASFIAFSQANMLSPNGLCHAFSAKADGFVRAEGAVVLILRKAAQAFASRNPIHGYILGTDVNSDGRTNGISLPNVQAQEALLRRVYSRTAIDFDRLAFVEAHGTGTPVGDPVEATAIGRSIGCNRSERLPIGSIKTNIGHLEPASGLASILKALLALNHGVLPPSLHFDEPNPNIDFEQLNLTVCTQPLLLPKAAEQCAGVNSFGFGGTNAHVIVGPARNVAPALPRETREEVFAFSANSSGALTELARKYLERVSQLSDAQTANVASAIAHRREWQMHRLVVTSTRSEDVTRALTAYISGTGDPNLMTGTAIAIDLPIAFIYSGNGSQWVGMGRSAYNNNSNFRRHFDQVDAYFKEIGGWSLKDALFSETLGDRLPFTSITQPLIFGIQSACTAALRFVGLTPAIVLGHSVGEVAAAETAGALDLRTAVKVIHFRSTHQEKTRGAGRMLAALGSADVIQEICKDIEGLEIAAFNSPRASTVAGSVDALARFKQIASECGTAVLDLDLEYPFHTALMGPIERPLKTDLHDVVARDCVVPFVSTVAGACLPGTRLDARYWWQNVREPVHFMQAVLTAAELGARCFVEIGPRPTLLKHVVDSLQGEVNGIATLAVLDRTDDESDPFECARAKAIVCGAWIDKKVFGADPGPGIELPHYPWQQTPFRFKPTVESKDVETTRHPFAGARVGTDSFVWHSHVDVDLYPELVDHKLADRVIFPGTGFLEVALAVAREWLATDHVLVSEFEILNPLDLTNGETREVMTRVSPGSSTLEIFSRPRLSQASWLQHVRCKVQGGNAAGHIAVPELGKSIRQLSDADIYRVASESGLNYGRAFRLLKRASIHEDGLIAIELESAPNATRFTLDPMRIDASAHGFFAVFPDVRAIERGVTYIPVRIEETAVYRPEIAPVRALIQITVKNERTIVGNCFVFGANGELIAVLRNVRSQAVNVRRAAKVESVAFIEAPRLIDGGMLGDTGVPARSTDILADVAAIKTASDANSEELLLEGWATTAAYEIATALAHKRVLDVDKLVTTERVPATLRNWLINMLKRLEAASLAVYEETVWTLVEEELPESTEIIKTIVTEHPGLAAEALLASAISRLAKQVKATGAFPAPEGIVPKAALDFYHSTSAPARVANETLARLLRDNKRLWPKNRTVRVLCLGSGRLAISLLSSQSNVHLTIFEPDRRRYEALELSLPKNRDVRPVDAEHRSELDSYDLIVGVSSLSCLPSTFGVAELKALLAPGGLLAVVEFGPSLFKDLIFGLEADWFIAAAPDVPISPLRSQKYWSGMLRELGFADAQSALLNCAGHTAEFIVGQIPGVSNEFISAPPTVPSKQTNVLLVGSPQSPLVEKLARLLLGAGLSVLTSQSPANDLAISPDLLILIPDHSSEELDSCALLTQRCLELKACAERLGNVQATLWIVFSGALVTETTKVRPIETGVWAFSRTMANEYPKLLVRRIDLAADLPVDAAAEHIRKILLSGTNETEIHLDRAGARAVRVESLRHVLVSKPTGRRVGVRLERRSDSGQRLSWQPVERRRPKTGEVEIEIEAAGLNFRDLMWSLSLLPEDMMEEGFSGATLGLECAGRVCHIGKSVKNIKVGDRVMAFAPATFASHVTIDSGQVLKLPDTMSVEAAATIPVAFFTAYYGLITQARLARREWVLIHSAAGAVGMAAVQIAQALGAKVIATSGSSAKRDLLRSLGVEHVLDSRSTSFVDDVRQITNAGVDVVLNSLAGEAMERSIACLRPFGRFVELGKRDYVANTHVGLRPFRRNLSYFGVDVDQVIGARGTEARKIFTQILRAFEKGTYTPSPYSVFDAENVSEAFHLMQHSGHIGKIVIRPPKNGVALVDGKPFQVSPEKTHIITGAFGGFGSETAKWLAEKGARHLVLIGRRGAQAPEAQALVRTLTSQGINVLAEPCDVADRAAIAKLFRTISAKMPPVAGVIHEAMVLDDGIIANLDADRFRRVLAPKVAGAGNLEHALRGLTVDYFVVFSSVTTLLGNPGQGNYVAANAYMEGVVRRRRQQGLPALAIGWGPIVDVGVVAQNEKLQAGLQKLTGVMGLRARDALDLMAQALEQRTDIPDTAVMTISPHEGSFGAERLAALRSPTYAAYISASGRGAQGEAEVVDLHALAMSEGIEAVHRKVADIISAQLAKVLYLREEDISHMRPLGEMGLDSLMGLELVMNLEGCFGIHIPLSGSSGAMTITDIANEVIAHVGLDSDREKAMIGKLAEQHHSEVDEAQLKTLKVMLTKDAQVPKRLLS